MSQIRLFYIILFVYLSVGFIPRAGAQLPFSTEITGSWIASSRSYKEAEFQSAFLFSSNAAHSFLVGPRLGIYLVNDNLRNRVDLQLGGVCVLWFMNVVGLGLGVDVLTHPESSWIHAQMNPFIETRLLHYKSTGAWALRLGVLYDSLYRWNGQVGVSLQFDGILPRASAI